MAGRLKAFIGILLVSAGSPGASGLAYGQSDASLPDPTRPPVTASEPALPGVETVAPAGGLQTIILGKGHKPRAVINGVMVELGGKIGDATLIKLNESEAVLQGPAGREVLQLLPGIGKRTESSAVKKVDGKKHDK